MVVILISLHHTGINFAKFYMKLIPSHNFCTTFYLFDQHAGKRCVRGVEDFPHDEGLEVSPDHWAIGHLDNGFIQILTERTWTDKQGKMNIRMQ